MMQEPMTKLFSPLSASLALLVGSSLVSGAAMAQSYPVTPDQKAKAEQVAQAGVPLSELAPNAPDSYTVKTGDTLWAISGLFLKSPWRWPELWGMNLQEIRNPHLIYPGQQLFLERKDGRAILTTSKSTPSPAEAKPEQPQIPTLRVSPRTRYSSLADSAIPALKGNLIEPFLAEPIIVNETALLSAPRIVATQEGRVLLSKGDRAYARGQASTPLLDEKGKPREFRVFRNATALKDPGTGVILGYEAQYVGKAELMRSESVSQVTDGRGKTATEIVPATIDIIGAKEEMRVGDRLLPEPPRQIVSYVPHAPQSRTEGRIVSVYGSAVANAAQNQVVVINRGTKDGVEVGHVLAILKDGERVVDRTDGVKTDLKLPDERNGLMMVFRPFENLSYALILQTLEGVKVGDRVVNPR